MIHCHDVMWLFYRRFTVARSPSAQLRDYTSIAFIMPESRLSTMLGILSTVNVFVYKLLMVSHEYHSYVPPTEN